MKHSNRGYWYKNREIDQWNKNSIQNNEYTDISFKYNMALHDIVDEKKLCYNNGSRINEYPHGER